MNYEEIQDHKTELINLRRAILTLESKCEELEESIEENTRRFMKAQFHIQEQQTTIEILKDNLTRSLKR